MRSTSLALVALSLTVLGCSGGVDALSPYQADTQTPLAIAGPHATLVYTSADDDDLDSTGIQLVLRVDVDDELIQSVELTLPGAALADVVAEDLAGRRAAFFQVTLAGLDTPVTARAAGAVEVQALLRALQ